MNIAFQGEKGAYSELAAKHFFNSRGNYLPLSRFSDVFRSVQNRECAYGIIPIENSLTGSIHENYDLLMETDTFISGEVFLSVSHYLIANKGVSRRSIKTVYSHPQAIKQCRRYLEAHSNLNVEAVFDTAGAVKMIKENNIRDAAAIASFQAAIDYDMKVLKKHMEDNHRNQTRFLILRPEENKKRENSSEYKTSIVFETKNIPGALFKALSVFALRDIDLFKIESRPVRETNFKYMFYLDFQGHYKDTVQEKALEHLDELTVYSKVLGSYKRGENITPEFTEKG